MAQVSNRLWITVGILSILLYPLCKYFIYLFKYNSKNIYCTRSYLYYYFLL